MANRIDTTDDLKFKMVHWNSLCCIKLGWMKTSQYACTVDCNRTANSKRIKTPH